MDGYRSVRHADLLQHVVNRLAYGHDMLVWLKAAAEPGDPLLKGGKSYQAGGEIFRLKMAVWQHTGRETDTKITAAGDTFYMLIASGGIEEMPLPVFFIS